jgi:hypothetical protein
MFEGTVTVVRLTAANAPTYVSATHVVTIPTVTGVTFRINGVVATAGAKAPLTPGQSSNVTASPNSGFSITGDDDWTFDY